jgi:putative membrane protein
MLRETPWTALRGFMMGAADIVPGVSGGTIALIVGIYERLIASVRAGSSALGHLLRGDVAGFRRWFTAVEWSFVIPLAVGILTAVVVLAGALESLLHDYPEEMAGLFTGLIAGSVLVAWPLVRRWTNVRIGVLIGTAVAVFVVLGFREGTTEETVRQFADPALWVFFLSGAIAICAMILPGISGSFLLVILSMYGPVLDAVNDRDLVTLAVFLLGTITGLALFSQLLNWALEHHHDTVMAALIGLMAGSLRVLWPWPDGLDSTVLAAPGGDVEIATILAALAFIVVIGLGRLGRRGRTSPQTEVRAGK